MIPACFPTTAAFKEWAQAADRCDEIASPCHDCTIAYQQAMTQRRLCNQGYVQRVYLIEPKKVLAQRRYEDRKVEQKRIRDERDAPMP